MLRDYLDKNQIKTLDQSITSEQINLLKTNVKQEIDHKQNEIHQLYLTKTDDIHEKDEQTKNLIDKYEHLQDKRQNLIEQIDDYTKLEDHARHINSNYHHVHHLNRFIDGLKQLINLQKQIHDCRQLCKKGLLNDAKNLCETISASLKNDYLFPKDPTKVYQQHDPIYETFQKSFKQLNSEIYQTHQSLWNDGIDRTKKNQFRFQLFYLDQLFQCTFSEANGERSLMEKNIQSFATDWYQRVIEILIEKKMKIRMQEETTNVQFYLEENDGGEEEGSIEEFNRMIKNLKEFFEVLNQYLFSRSIQISTQKSIPLIKIFSPVIANDFIELIREHLLNLIPNDFQDLDNFRTLLHTIIDFEQYLLQIDFVSSSTVLSSVIGDIDEAIIKSRCRKYLTECRERLKSTSLKTIEFGDEEELFEQNELLKKQYHQQIDSNLLTATISLDALDANIFRFPRTIIIEHVYDYIQYLRQILQEADQLTHYAAHLCATARNSIELFHIIYRNLHEKQAEEVPYLTALHFNTYMYVAHQCLILGEEYYHLKAKTADKQPITFVDYVPVFRNQAASFLQIQLDNQKEILTSFLREIGAFHNLSNEDENKDLLKRAIDKCLMQIENLSRNWKNVFSSRVYFRLIGHLCDHVSQFLSKETLALEDIPEQECQMMVDVYTHWSTFLQNLLIKDPASPGLNSIGEFAPNLTRFNELCLLLNSSMQTIVDRWFNGQGPLASQFTAIQIRQLIRALFQTSERRTAALAKIQ